jgi:hypothetical protein
LCSPVRVGGGTVGPAAAGGQPGVLRTVISFRYSTGQEVRLGDVVRHGYGQPLDTVARIFEPYTEESEWFLCEQTGGVMLEPSMCMCVPGHPGWVDVELVSRGDAPRG